jgi:hypothetical protein
LLFASSEAGIRTSKSLSVFYTAYISTGVEKVLTGELVVAASVTISKTTEAAYCKTRILDIERYNLVVLSPAWYKSIAL